MENKKQEIILKAWGHNIPNGGIDENGWSKESCTYGTFDVIKYDQQHYLEGAYIRPKSLKGVENNNGWIIINNTEDLPKEECWVRVFCQSNVPDSPICYRTLKSKVIKEMLPYITHFQPIITPAPPIY